MMALQVGQLSVEGCAHWSQQRNVYFPGDDARIGNLIVDKLKVTEFVFKASFERPKILSLLEYHNIREAMTDLTIEVSRHRPHQGCSVIVLNLF